jgi:hypothetical protein
MTGNLITWKKSSYSGSSGNCVEVAQLAGGGRAVRDSKDADGAVLRFGASQWRTFLSATKAASRD